MVPIGRCLISPNGQNVARVARMLVHRSEAELDRTVV